MSGCTSASHASISHAHFQGVHVPGCARRASYRPGPPVAQPARATLRSHLPAVRARRGLDRRLWRLCGGGSASPGPAVGRGQAARRELRVHGGRLPVTFSGLAPRLWARGWCRRLRAALGSGLGDRLRFLGDALLDDRLRRGSGSGLGCFRLLGALARLGRRRHPHHLRGLEAFEGGVDPPPGRVEADDDERALVAQLHDVTGTAGRRTPHEAQRHVATGRTGHGVGPV